MKRQCDPEFLRKVLERQRRRDARVVGQCQPPKPIETCSEPPSNGPISAEIAAAEQAILEIFSDQKLPRMPTALTAAAGACASYSEKIPATYVSPVIYDNLSCRQMCERSEQMTKYSTRNAKIARGISALVH